MSDTPVIIGLGEALFDVFPDQERLGGAPLNVAVHAHQLGNTGIVASRIGDDERGRQIMRHLRFRDMRSDYLQIDTARDTGIVNVTLDDGEPSYEIVLGAAWDSLRFDRRFGALASQCDAVCFGTLGQRQSESRAAIQRFVESATAAVRLFDVNLRQEFYSGPLIKKSLKLASAAKLNSDELAVVSRLLEIHAEDEAAAATHLREQFALDFVAVTRGPRGVVVYTEAGYVEAEPVKADLSGGDRVGAGDSTAAALLHGKVRNWPWERTVKLANTIGALVASRCGACPPLDDVVKRRAAE
jgi:fructokinase